MNTDMLWKRFVFLISVDSFGEKEVITEGKKQKMFLGSIDKHKTIFDQAVREMEELEAPKTPTTVAALHDVLELCKQGMRWYDQGHGHGHWEFVLDPEKFYDLFEAMKVADNSEVKMAAAARWEFDLGGEG